MAPRLRPRRPSAALVIALIALFVALGGPAEAAHLIDGKLLKRGSVSGAAIKDRSVTVRDLSKSTVRKLQSTPSGSITPTKIANGAITPGKLARGAVTSGAIAAGGVASGNLATGSVGSPQVADGSLTGADIADGGLSANDIGRFWGQFSVVLGRDSTNHDHPINPGECWSGEPVGLAAERAGANINKDVVLVTPGPQWPDKKLSLTVRQSVNPSRFVLIACNPLNGTPTTDNTVAPGTQVVFNYVIIDVP
jgi:hypothetical protein